MGWGWKSLTSTSLGAGDAFNMRHPLTGGGMTVALSDTQLLCDMLRPLPDFSDALLTARTTAAFYTRRKPLSATINTLANALYRVRMSQSLKFRRDNVCAEQGLPTQDAEGAK